MRKFLGLMGIVLAGAAPVGAADPQHPTVVELFQSQGCSSCPPAGEVFNELAGRADLLPLSFAVTYWDRLGWEDTFAQPAFTQRQWDYARAGKVGEVWTPQIIINGRASLVGDSRDDLLMALEENDRGTSGPAINRSAEKVTIGAAPTKKTAIVWLVQYDPRLHKISVRAGENRGKTLPHRNVVRLLQRLGVWRGKEVSFDLPEPKDAAYESAVLVQEGRGGPIIAAARL